MKRYAILLALLASVSSFLSCDNSGSEMKPSTGSITITVSPGSLSFSGKGGNEDITLSLSSTAAWSSSSDSWISVSPSSGKGNATVTVSVKENTGISSRNGSVTFTLVSNNSVKKTVAVNQDAAEESKSFDVVANPDKFEGKKLSSTTYQLLVYSFADSDGDGIGDFNGITSKLDYLDDMGVTALWLSPIHPSMSYHGYDVTDYYSVNPSYGTLDDFENLLSKAAEKDIDIYLDFVLNHSGKDHPWFQSASDSETSKYRDYYIFSKTPKSDIENGKIPMISSEGSNGYISNQWISIGGGSNGRYKFVLNTSSSNPTVTVTETAESTSSGTSSVGWNLYYGNDKTVYFKPTGANTYECVVDFESDWGFLIRKAANWDTGSKYGAKQGNVITLGSAFTLYPSTSSFDPKDILFTEPYYYHSHFETAWFADFNYGDVSTCETSAAFLDLANAADKWIKLGVKGLRLDAVKHIYHNATSNENPTFLKKWYDHCNATYKAAGGIGEMFMVGEALDDHSVEGPYYAGLPSMFEFSYWWKLRDALNNSSAISFPATVMGYIKAHKATNPEAITSIKLSNHDEARAASELGKSLAKEKQAAAFLLTSEGKPFIYQGEELGYYGTQDSGDEYVRTPIKWTKNGSVASNGVNGKVDESMLTSSISVEAQLENKNSLLNVYSAFSEVRNTYPALAEGTMSSFSGNKETAIAAWYMTSTDGTSKMLVVHNTSSSSKSLTVSDDMSHAVALLGSAHVEEDTLTLGGNSSVVFKLK